MPIDASIPLQAKGLQLESPVNQLVMMTEAAKLGELNRGIEEQNKLNEYLKSGADLASAEGRRGLINYGKTGLGYAKALNEQDLSAANLKKTSLEVDEKKLGIMRERSKDLLQNTSNENFIAHTQENVRDGLITPQQGQQAIQNYTNIPPNQRVAFISQNLAKAEDIYRQSQENMRHATPSGSALVQANATLATKQESEFEKTLGGELAKDVVKGRTAAKDAAEILRTNEIGRNILNSGAITGAGADFFVGLNQGLKTAGVDFGYGDAAANSQAYAATMAGNVGKLIKQYGAGTGLSDADREFATKAAAGSVNMDEKAIRKVLDINDRAARNIVNSYNKEVEGIKSKTPLKVEIPGASGSKKITSDAEYNALPSGTTFTAPDGSIRRKP